MKKIENIIVIGTDGKFVSDVARLLADGMEKYFLDLADLIRFDYALEAESDYAYAESLACKRVADFENTVISVTPGAAECEENMVTLSKNGVLICLYKTSKPVTSSRYANICLLCNNLKAESVVKALMEKLK